MDELLSILCTLKSRDFYRLVKATRDFQAKEDSDITEFEPLLKPLIAEDSGLMDLFKAHVLDISASQLEDMYEDRNKGPAEGEQSPMSEGGVSRKRGRGESADREYDEENGGNDSALSRSASRSPSYPPRRGSSLSQSRSRSSRSRDRSNESRRSGDSRLDSSERIRRHTTFNAFVGDLAITVTDTMLRKEFEPCGEIISVNVVRDKGYGFVNFATEEGLKKALSCDGMIIEGKHSRVQISESRTTLYIGNISDNVRSSDLRVFVEKHGGPIQELSVKSGFCFVSYKNFQDAEYAMSKLKEEQFDGNNLNVQLASRNKHESRSSGEAQKPSKTLYLRNISNDVTESELRKEFEEYGNVLRVSINPSQRSSATRNSHFGFVVYEEMEDAIKAREDMNDRSIKGKTLRVEFSRPTSTRTSSRGAARSPPRGSKSRRREVRLPRGSIPPPMFGGQPLLGWDDRSRRYISLSQNQVRDVLQRWVVEVFPDLGRRVDSFDGAFPPRSSRGGRGYDIDSYADPRYDRYEPRDSRRERKPRYDYDDIYNGYSRNVGSSRRGHYDDERRSSRYRPY